MLHPRENLSNRDAVAAELIGGEPVGRFALSIQNFAEGSLGGLSVPLSLHEDVEHVSILVNSSPEVVDSAIDPDEDFVGAPSVTKAALAPSQ